MEPVLLCIYLGHGGVSNEVGLDAQVHATQLLAMHGCPYSPTVLLKKQWLHRWKTRSTSSTLAPLMTMMYPLHLATTTHHVLRILPATVILCS